MTIDNVIWTYENITISIVYWQDKRFQCVAVRWYVTEHPHHGHHVRPQSQKSTKCQLESGDYSGPKCSILKQNISDIEMAK